MARAHVRVEEVAQHGVDGPLADGEEVGAPLHLPHLEEVAGQAGVGFEQLLGVRTAPVATTAVAEEAAVDGVVEAALGDLAEGLLEDLVQTRVARLGVAQQRVVEGVRVRELLARAEAAVAVVEVGQQRALDGGRDRLVEQRFGGSPLGVIRRALATAAERSALHLLEQDRRPGRGVAEEHLALGVEQHDRRPAALVVAGVQLRSRVLVDPRGDRVRRQRIDHPLVVQHRVLEVGSAAPPSRVQHEEHRPLLLTGALQEFVVPILPVECHGSVFGRSDSSAGH